MASGNIAPQNFRKALGALKDSTKVGMAIVNSEYKDIDVAIVKATNHDEVHPKEKHVRKIFYSVSSSSPRADVAYCILALARRLSKTHSWTVALKTLIVVHRGLREVDPTFQQELISYNDNKGHLLNLSHFKDDSTPKAWENSSWVRCYALYLEESLECFRTLKYDIQKDCSRTKVLDTPDLLEQLPRLQQLLFRLLECQPVGAARHSFLIQYALSIVAAESVKLYVAITDATVNLVDKFFEMQRHDAVRALEIYKKAAKQAEKLSVFFEVCRNFDFGRGQKYAKIEQPPVSFLTAMEDYVNEAPQALMLPWRANDNDKLRNPEAIIAGETSLDINHECSNPSVASLEVSKNDKGNTTATPPVADLLNLDDLFGGEVILADTNPLALAVITPTEDQANINPNSHLLSQSNSWELALVSAPSSHLASVTPSTLGGRLDRLTLDTLYDSALAKTSANGTYQVPAVPSNPFEDSSYLEFPLFLPTNAVPHTHLQFFDMTTKEEPAMQQQQHPDLLFLDMTTNEEPLMQQQQQYMFGSHESNEEPLMQQQQQYMFGSHDSTNPFGNPFLDQDTSYPTQNLSQHTG